MSAAARHKLLHRQLNRCFGEHPPISPAWERFLTLVNEHYVEADAEQEMLERCMDLASQELFAANLEMRAVAETVPDVVLRLDAGGVLLNVHGSLTADLALRAFEMVGKPVRELKLPQTGPAFNEAFSRAVKTNERLEVEYGHEDGDRSYYYEARFAPLPNGSYLAIIRDISKRKATELQLARAQAERAELARRAGMAEVAVEVIHHIGNVLNSANVSSTLLLDRVRHSKVALLPKIVKLLDQHSADLPRFIAEDSRGKALPQFIKSLARHLVGEQARSLQELESLCGSIDRVKGIVAMQQEYTGSQTVTEPVRVSEVIAEALGPHAAELARQGIQVVTTGNHGLLVSVDKHQVVGILEALISNAKHACAESACEHKTIELHVAMERERFRLSVRDNGVGLTASNRKQVFRPGFTTRPQSLGLSLHNAALQTSLLGGHLSFHSGGPGLGSTFILDLPAPSGTESPLPA